VQRGASIATIGAGATRLDTLRNAVHIPAAPGTTHAALMQAISEGGRLAVHVSERSVLIWNGRMSEPVAAVLAYVAHATGMRVLPTPQAANELGCQAAGLGTHTPDQVLEAVDQGTVKAVVLLGADPIGAWPSGDRWRGLMERAFFALQVSAFQNGSTGWATTIVPAALPLEKEGTTTNLEGRVQRMRAAVAPPSGVLDGVQLTTALGRRLGLDLPADPASAFRDMAGSRQAFTGLAWHEIGEHGVRPQPPALGPPPPVPHVGEAEPQGTIVIGYRQLMSGPTVEHTPALQFQRRSGIEIAHADAQTLGIATGDRVEVAYGGSTVTGAAVVHRRLMRGVVRMPAAVPYLGPGELRAAAEAADA